MKKIFAVLSIVALASCGGQGTSTEVVADSTAVVDSVKQDTTAVVVDSAAVKVEEVK